VSAAAETTACSATRSVKRAWVVIVSAAVSGSKVNPGSPLGQPWVPDFWRASVGPRRKLGNGGSR